MVYVLLADGFEEIEALAPVDILRRSGIEVQTVGVSGRSVCGAHQIPVTADITMDEIEMENLEALILPGGPGHEVLDRSNAVHGLINYTVVNALPLAAICAAPSILGKKHLLAGKRATCFPGYEATLYGSQVVQDSVVVDGNVITARGAGAASEFAFQIVTMLKGEQTANQVKAAMQY
jgi:4-methyl-5(b-hydroxyethyl)-thiazole monophosphate biosynthesis